jgi:hypothetical protein
MVALVGLSRGGGVLFLSSDFLSSNSKEKDSSRVTKRARRNNASPRVMKTTETARYCRLGVLSGDSLRESRVERGRTVSQK